MFKKLLTFPLLWVFLLGLLLRLIALGDLPAGFHVDEVKVGWNAYSLWLTGRDDWLHAFPLHYDTFGDQRPTGIFYVTVPALAFFSLTQFAVRFTPALFGSLAPVAIYFLALYLTRRRSAAVCAALMLAISPWHVTLSRATSEGIVATTLILFALVLQIKSFSSHRSTTLTAVSALLYLAAYFLYHTSRLLIPLFIFTTAAYYFFTTPDRKIHLPSVFLFVITSLLTVILTFSPAARGRLSQVSIFNDQGIKIELDRLPFEEGPNHIFVARALHNKVVLYTSRFLNEYTQYFSGKFFLTFEEAKPARYQTATRGLLLYIELALLVIGLVAVAQKRSPPLPLLLLLLSPLPAAITTEDAPNLHRALLMAPFISLLAGFGLAYLARFSKRVNTIVIILLFLDLFHFGHMYVVHDPMRDTLTLPRNVGAVELITALQKYSPQYSRIYLTNRPDNIYPWFAFLTRQDPRIFNPDLARYKSQDFTWKNIIFSQFRCPTEYVQDHKLKGVLSVNAEGCPLTFNQQLVENIERKSGGITYTLWQPKN